MKIEPKSKFRLITDEELESIAGGDAPGAPGSGIPGSVWDLELGGWVDANGFGSAFGGLPNAAFGGGAAAEGPFGGDWILVSGSASGSNGGHAGSQASTSSDSSSTCNWAEAFNVVSTTTGNYGTAVGLLALIPSPTTAGLAPVAIGSGVVSLITWGGGYALGVAGGCND